MNWRDRLASVRESPDSELTKPTKALLAVLAVDSPPVSRLDCGTGEQDMRSHLLGIATGDGRPASLVHGLADADVEACAGLPDDTLRAYLRAVERGQRMDAGELPPEWGEAVARTCEGCGPVLLWPQCPAIVKACPWCFRRKAGKAIPRPDRARR